MTARVFDQANSHADKWIKDVREELLFLDGIKEGYKIRQIAVAERELGMLKIIDNQDKSSVEREMDRKKYIKQYAKLKANYNWDKLIG